MMPLIVKEFDWRQTEQVLTLSVKIKGVKSARTSVVTSNNYIRVYFAPYIFELFLYEDVDDVQGSCTIDETLEHVHFQLPKVEMKEWTAVEKMDLSRNEKREIRDEAVKLSQKRAAEEKEVLAAKRHEQKQFTVHETLRLDSAERERIATIKNVECTKALAQLNKWNSEEEKESHSIISHPSTSSMSNENKQFGLASTHEMGDCQNLTNCIGDGNNRESDLLLNSPMIDFIQSPIRQAGHISVTFSQREFPTPSRESTATAENEWLKKQAEARRRSGFDDKDLRPEEKDPSWRLEKGISLTNSESYLGAISAFSLGIKLAPKMYELHMERAKAHLSLRNLHKAAEDSSQALELLTPKIDANAKERVRCHEIRASAFNSMNLLRESLMDYEEALRIQPDNTKLLQSKEKVAEAISKRELEGNSSDDEN